MKSDLEDFNIDYTQHRYLRTPDAAKLLGLSGRTLEKHHALERVRNISNLAGVSSIA